MSKKELAFSIVSFLKSEVKNENQNADNIGGLEVAISWIESAYGLKRFKPEHDTNLLNIFNSVSNKDSTQLLRNKREADDFKNKGNMFMNTELYEEAIDSYTKAIELDSKNAVYYCNRAAAWIKLNNNQKAISDCECAINIDPTYCKAYGRLGLVYRNEKQFDKAVANYKKAVSLEPHNYAYKSNLELSEHSLSGAKSTQIPTSNPENPFVGLNFDAVIKMPSIKNRVSCALKSILAKYPLPYLNMLPSDMHQNAFSPLLTNITDSDLDIFTNWVDALNEEAAASSLTMIPPTFQTAPTTLSTQKISSQLPTNVIIPPDLD
ncbi:small glutamine-rich tetratricopeptide repeat-containing protein beta-like isoform X2 [Hydra vulgaris]|uniref:Small glutamine-rich tetratricopeptide repeat-containing protein beta-like isoform X2 n=1 Tax=Hydra vulgaris TaxID=6087 RepID=A0ABM4CTU2_HYDVU